MSCSAQTSCAQKQDQQQDQQVYTSVKDYYGKVLQTTNDLKTSACTGSSKPHPIVCRLLRTLPQAVTDKFYGCGNPLPLGIAGKDVLDLGSGSGRDCYVAAALVGPQGSVTGVDMTDEQLQTARENIDAFGQTLGYQPNLKFLTGYIEALEDAGVANESKDICISNCVVNLSPNKPQVLAGVYTALRSGGEFHFSDMYSDRTVPESVRQHEELHGEGLTGALFANEFERIVKKIGFVSPRVLSIRHISIFDEQFKQLVGDTNYFSITYRLFKVPSAIGDANCTATYLGTVEGHEERYLLDIDNSFDTNVPRRVSANTATILKESWLAKYFVVESVVDNNSDSQTIAEKRTPTECLMKSALQVECSSSALKSCSK
ncbi:hypothetical protein LPJ66_003602 [Kickxella alabastrina]|uniref:Uncharacterized protein n=1 Tax=Kickxella alabastrina TaxID=61397 RepID=A0ACC1IMW7_9FUNG|nr:hypothetical protein LPJ66_003602 [Kickxella alabastrina]